MEPQVLKLFLSQLKHEIGRETGTIPLNAFIEILRVYSIQLRQVNIEHDLAAANDEYPLTDGF